VADEICADIATRHPVVRSFEPGDSWRYYYADDLIVE